MSVPQPPQHKKDLHSGPNHTRPQSEPDSSDAFVRSRTDGISDAGKTDYAVAHGVELGYRVIDRYVRQGQRAAERLNSGGHGNASDCDSDASVGDLRENLEELVERLLRLTVSLIPQRTEVEEVLGWGRDFVRGLLRQWIPNPSGDGAPADGNKHVSVEVSSSRPIRVTLDLRARTNRLTLMGQGLRAVNSQAQLLGGVAFVDSDEDDCPVVRIRVADDQPTGNYTGVVTDAQSGEPCGTLSVRVGA